MVDEIFEAAGEKLIAYTATDDYKEALRNSAREIAALFEDNDCVIMLSERDMSAAEEIKGFFGGNVQVQADQNITIGGIKCFCESKSIIADETLDTKLQAQREWFVEHAALSVV